MCVYHKIFRLLTANILSTDYDSDYNPDTVEETNEKQNPEYYDQPREYEDPVTSQRVEGLSQLETSPPNQAFEQPPTTASVSEFSIANAVNLRGECFYYQI